MKKYFYALTMIAFLAAISAVLILIITKVKALLPEVSSARSREAS